MYLIDANVCNNRLFSTFIANVCVIEKFARHITSKFFKFKWHSHSLCKRLSKRLGKMIQTFVVG
jgi:hypothetical protein